MTQEEILQYNKRCAEFLGLTPTQGLSSKYYQYYKKIEDDKTMVYNQVSFHSDWNWIMEVIEAIEKLGLNCKIGSFWATIEPKMASEINYKPLNIPHSQLDNDLSKKEAVVETINQFLIWYEQNKTI